MPPIFKTDPWPHQLRAYEYAMSRDAAGLWYDMGTGKSKVAVDVVRNTGARRTLILAPLAVCSVWPGQFATHCADPAPEVMRFDSSAASGSAAKREAAILDALGAADQGGVGVVIVMNYDAAWRMPKLLGVEWDVVILDEAHRVKGPTSKINKWAHKLTAAKRLGLSGTPTPNDYLDAFGVYKVLDDRVFGRYVTHFRARYAICGNPHIPQQITGWRNVEEIEAKMATLAISCRKQDVLKDLPPALDEWIWVPIPPAARRAHLDMERQLAAFVEAEGERRTVTAANVLTKSLVLQQIAGGWLPERGVDDDTGRNVTLAVHHLHDAKQHALADLIDGLAPDEPLVVMARFTREVEAAAATAQRMGRVTYRLDGGHKQHVEWAHARGGEVLVVQIQAGSAGIDLTRARYCVYLSTGYNGGDYEQSRARIHRPGQRNAVTYYHIGAEGTIDRAVAQALEEKGSIQAAILRRLKFYRAGCE